MFNHYWNNENQSDNNYKNVFLCHVLIVQDTNDVNITLIRFYRLKIQTLKFRSDVIIFLSLHRSVLALPATRAPTGRTFLPAIVNRPARNRAVVNGLASHFERRRPSRAIISTVLNTELSRIWVNNQNINSHKCGLILSDFTPPTRAAFCKAGRSSSRTHLIVFVANNGQWRNTSIWYCLVVQNVIVSLKTPRHLHHIIPGYKHNTLNCFFRSLIFE